MNNKQIRFNGDEYYDPREILEKLKYFKEIDLSLLSPKRELCSLQEKVSHRAWFMSHMLFTPDYSNEYLLGCINTLEAIIVDERKIDMELVRSFEQFVDILKEREVVHV